MPKARTRHTCTECSLRRQQCDRRIPCGRCIKRGCPEKCQLNWQDGRYDPAKHRVYPSKHRDLTSRSSSQSVLDVDSIDVHEDTPDPIASFGLQPVAASAYEATPTAPRPRYSFTPWQRKRLRKTAADLANDGRSFLLSSTDLDIDRANGAHETYLQTLIPSVDHIWKLIDYHEQYLLWYHCCYHGPTFRCELEGVINEQHQKGMLDVRGLDLQWMALLLSIMTASLTCTAEWRLRDWGFSKDESVKLSRQWYKASISCLNHGSWTSDHSIYSVKAITTLIISAHSLGCSAELSVLLGGAIKVAQALGLDRLEYDAAAEFVDAASPNSQRQNMLERDTGRKLWSQLCVQDWTSLPSSGSHCINPAHFTSTLPSSRDYLTMEAVPATFPTYISYGNYLFEIAKLVVRHHEATLQSTTPYTRYQHVLDYDAQMRELATKAMPRYFHVTEPVDALWPEWVHWARSSLTVSFAHKIILIHREYIRSSFTNPAYSMTRITCVAAAKTILNEANKTRNVKAPIIWVDKAFCVVAALIICLDLFHRQAGDVEAAALKKLVSDFIQQLEAFEHSVIAVRGSTLLREIIRRGETAAVNGVWPPQGIDASDLLEICSPASERQSVAAAKSRSAPQLLPPPAGLSNHFILETLFAPQTPR